MKGVEGKSFNCLEGARGSRVRRTETIDLDKDVLQLLTSWLAKGQWRRLQDSRSCVKLWSAPWAVIEQNSVDEARSRSRSPFCPAPPPAALAGMLGKHVTAYYPPLIFDIPSPSSYHCTLQSHGMLLQCLLHFCAKAASMASDDQFAQPIVIWVSNEYEHSDPKMRQCLSLHAHYI